MKRILLFKVKYYTNKKGNFKKNTFIITKNKINCIVRDN